MSSARSKDALFEAIAVMGKAFASPRRLELIDLLAQGPRGVDELARASGQSTANATAFFPLGPRCRTVRTGMRRMVRTPTRCVPPPF